MKVTVKEKKSKNDPIAKLSKMNDMTLSWGFFEDAPDYPDGTPVATVAKLNEEGHEINTPPRPFMSTQADAAKPKLRFLVKKYYKEMVKKYITPTERLEKIGEIMVNDLQEEILSFSNPINADSTVRQKGFDDPLWETGHMYNNVDYKIKKGGKTK